MIDPESVRQEVLRHLPVRMRLLIDRDSLDFDFSRSRAPLCVIAPTDVNDVTIIETEWTSLYLFGREDCSYGGGASLYLGVHCDTGEIYGLDIERKESQVFLLNSNVDRFIRTVQKIDKMLRHTHAVPRKLSEALMEIDPSAFEHSDWKDFSSYVEAGT